MQSITLRNGVKMPLLGYGVLVMKDQEECEKCVRRALQTDYIDLYLIHQPYNDYYGAWRTLEKICQQGRARNRCQQLQPGAADGSVPEFRGGSEGHRCAGSRIQRDTGLQESMHCKNVYTEKNHGVIRISFTPLICPW